MHLFWWLTACLGRFCCCLSDNSSQVAAAYERLKYSLLWFCILIVVFLFKEKKKIQCSVVTYSSLLLAPLIILWQSRLIHQFFSVLCILKLRRCQAQTTTAFIYIKCIRSVRIYTRTYIRTLIDTNIQRVKNASVLITGGKI